MSDAMHPNSFEPVETALARWVPSRVLRSKEPFAPEQICAALSSAQRKQLVLDFDDVLGQVRAATKSNIYWNLPPLQDGDLPAYVMPGPRQRSRLIHAGLFADRVLVAPPQLPSWQLLSWSGRGSGPADVLRFTPTSRPQPASSPGEGKRSQGQGRADPIDIDAILDEIDLDIGIDAEAEAAAHRRGLADLEEELPLICASLLSYWWEVREPLAQGWLQVVGRGVFVSDNVKDICKDEEFRGALPEWVRTWDGGSQDPWWQLLTATGLAHTLGREHVAVFPGSGRQRDLVSLT